MAACGGGCTGGNASPFGDLCTARHKANWLPGSVAGRFPLPSHVPRSRGCIALRPADNRWLDTPARGRGVHEGCGLRHGFVFFCAPQVTRRGMAPGQQAFRGSSSSSSEGWGREPSEAASLRGGRASSALGSTRWAGEGPMREGDACPGAPLAEGHCATARRRGMRVAQHSSMRRHRVLDASDLVPERGDEPGRACVGCPVGWGR